MLFIINFCSEFTPETTPSSKHWSFDEGFKYNRMERGMDAFPFRSFQTGTRGSLHIISKVLHDNFDSFCTDIPIGFRMIVHTPYEIPILRYRFEDISNDGSTDVLIKPKVILPTADLNAFSSTDLKCFLQSERKLKFFQMYTQNNCFTECGWNMTLKMCKCSSIGMPREYKIQA